MVVINGIVEQALPAALNFMGKVSSSIGSTVVYTEEFIAHVAEYSPEFLHLLGL